MTEDLEAKSDELREMVENHWRNLIRLSGLNPQMAGEEVFRFEAMIDQMALTYTPVQAAWFRSTVLALRARYADWERTDPDALRQALKVTGGGKGTATAWLANLETPASIDLRDQLDTFWREILVTGIPNPKTFEARSAQFIGKLQAQVARLPQPEQDGILTRLILRNSEYIALAQKDREVLKAQLGVFVPSPSVSTAPSAIAETAVRATIWYSIGALVRAFR
jgi:hypothetical protein